MFNKIPTSLHFPLLFFLHLLYGNYSFTLVYFSDIEPLFIHVSLHEIKNLISPVTATRPTSIMFATWICVPRSYKNSSYRIQRCPICSTFFRFMWQWMSWDGNRVYDICANMVVGVGVSVKTQNTQNILLSGFFMATRTSYKSALLMYKINKGRFCIITLSQGPIW